MMYQYLQNIFIYIIVMTIISCICPKGQYEKIVRFFAGLILVVIVLGPIIQIGNIDTIFNKFISQNKLQTNLRALQESQRAFEQDQIEAIIMEYKREIAQQIVYALEANDLYVRHIEIGVVEDVNSEDFGTILLINIGADTSNLNSSNTIKIDRIIISTKESVEVKSAEEIIFEKKVKEIVMELYRVTVDKIVVNIYEGDE